MDPDFWSNVIELLTALAGGGGALAFVLKWWFARKRAANVNDTVRAMAEVREVYEALNDVLMEVGGAGRAMLLRSENGGGIPSANRPVYSSVLHEVHGTSLEPIRERWQRMKVDEQYARLLHELATKGYVQLDTASMEPGSLRTSYEAAGVACAMVCAVVADDTGFNYLSVVCTESKPDQIAVNTEAVRGCANRLRTILSNDKTAFLPEHLHPYD